MTSVMLKDAQCSTYFSLRTHLLHILPIKPIFSEVI